MPGGRLAELFGSKRVFGWSMGGVAILAALTPVLANTAGVYAVIIIRIIQVNIHRFREVSIPA